MAGAVHDHLLICSREHDRQFDRDAAGSLFARNVGNPSSRVILLLGTDLKRA